MLSNTGIWIYFSEYYCNILEVKKQLIKKYLWSVMSYTDYQGLKQEKILRLKLFMRMCI